MTLLNVKRLNLKSSDPVVWEDESLAQYLRNNTHTTLEEIRTAKKKIKEHKLSESNIFQRILGLLWYGVLGNIKLTPKTLVKILTHLDQLLPYISDKRAKEIIKVLDKIAESVYKNMG